MTPDQLRAILGRDPSPAPWPEAIYHGRHVVVTGAAGSIGPHLLQALDEMGATVVPTDLDGPVAMDVTVNHQVGLVLRAERPAVVFHLAGAKHAPLGELEPGVTARVNVDGTRNVLGWATVVKAPVVTASTCKAADPETAYGASKLLAERMTLAAGGQVARFYNVPNTSGNVFELWGRIPGREGLPVAACHRYFISMHEALSVLLHAGARALMGLPSWRLACYPGEPQFMPDVAARLYPHRDQFGIPPRRGDRQREPICAASERLMGADLAQARAGHLRPGCLARIVGLHDPAD